MSALTLLHPTVQQRLQYSLHKHYYFIYLAVLPQLKKIKTLDPSAHSGYPEWCVSCGSVRYVERNGRKGVANLLDQIKHLLLSRVSVRPVSTINPLRPSTVLLPRHRPHCTPDINLPCALFVGLFAVRRILFFFFNHTVDGCALIAQRCPRSGIGREKRNEFHRQGVSKV